MTATNAGGGDWLDLPTRPVQHRGRRLPEGLPWGEITDQYVASGGQVDAGVWPKHSGTVRLVESGKRGADRVHTIEERTADYDSLLTQGTPTVASNRAALAPAKQRDVAFLYRRGATIAGLADAFGVSVTSIRTALKNTNEPIRSRNEAQRARRAQEES
jgi:hypothetical protein